MTIAVIRAPRDVRASRAWKVGHYAVQPVTIRYPDGSVKVVHQEQAKPAPKRRKSRKVKSKARAVRVVGTTPTRLTDSERIAREWEIFNALSNDEREQYL